MDFTFKSDNNTTVEKKATYNLQIKKKNGNTADACQDGYMFASHASTSLFCLSEQYLLHLKLLYDIFLCRVNQ